MLTEIFKPFVEASPLSVMMRGLAERLLNGHFISLTPPWMKVGYCPEECLPKVAVGMVV
jgi:hypothetical protein